MAVPLFRAMALTWLLLVAQFVISAPAPSLEDQTVMRTAHYTAKNKEARDKLIDGFTTIAKYSLEHEMKQVSRYLVTVPWDEKDETSLYTIEHYASHSALKSHDHSAPAHPFQDLIITPPEIHTWHPSGFFQRPDILSLTHNSTSKILIVYGTVDYTYIPSPSPSSSPTISPPPPQDSQTCYFPDIIFPAFLTLCQTLMQTEPGTYGTTFLADFKNQTQALRVVEIFESLEHYQGQHRANTDITEFMTRYPPRGKDLAEVRVVGGFFGRA